VSVGEAMSKGPGSTQRFIMRELTTAGEGEWLLVQDLIRRFAQHKSRSVDISIERSVRNAYYRLANPLEPKIELRWINGQLHIRSTPLGRMEQTNPWAIKELEMADVWKAVQAEQVREEARATKRKS
jgi:hypothetical protein